jgi:hypothetical protein
MIDKQWFALISAAPKPETHESVVVGLVIGTGRRINVEYLKSLPRLACLVSPTEVAVYRAAIQLVGERLQSKDELGLVRSLVGPHLLISEPRQIYCDVTPKLVQRLRRDYLAVSRKEPREEGFRSYSRELYTRLDSLITSVVPLMPMRLERRPTPDKLYPSLPGSIFRSDVPPLHRAIRGPRRDLLIGGVVVADSADPLDPIRGPTVRVSKAFWQYRQAKEALQRHTGRDIRTVGVLLNGSEAPMPAVLDAKQYIRHLWEADADHVIFSQTDMRGEFRQDIEWLAR